MPEVASRQPTHVSGGDLTKIEKLINATCTYEHHENARCNVGGGKCRQWKVVYGQEFEVSNAAQEIKPRYRVARAARKPTL